MNDFISQIVLLEQEILRLRTRNEILEKQQAEIDKIFIDAAIAGLKERPIRPVGRERNDYR